MNVPGEKSIRICISHKKLGVDLLYAGFTFLPHRTDMHTGHSAKPCRIILCILQPRRVKQ